MTIDTDLTRHLRAHERDYALALAEIKSGRKKSHWMWYIFPQVTGLGFSVTSKLYAIQSLQEAFDYLNHPVLGARLREIAGVLVLLEEKDVRKIFNSPDDLKLKSCMTLFAHIDLSPDKTFQRVLDKYFEGNEDQKTLHQIRLWQGDLTVEPDASIGS